jgi:hypothetical protein
LAPICKHKKYRALGPIRQELSLLIYIIIYIKRRVNALFFFNTLTTIYTIAFISKKGKKDIIKSELISGTSFPAPEGSKRPRAPNTIYEPARVGLCVQGILGTNKNLELLNH